MQNTTYYLDVGQHTDLAFIRNTLHNELVALKTGLIRGKHFDEKRAFLRTFITLVEGVSFQLRQHLLRINEDGAINLSLSEQVVLSEKEYQLSEGGVIREKDKYHSAIPLFKLTWKLFAKHHQKEIELRQFMSDNGMTCLVASYAKRNAIVHPKKFPDIQLNEGDWKTVQEARKWFLKMSIAVLKDNLHQRSQ